MRAPRQRHVSARVRRVAVAAVCFTSAMGLALGLTTIGAVGPFAPLASQVVSAAQDDAAAEVPQGRPPLDEPAVPVRIRIPSLGIDLPVVSSERTVPGNSRDYPLCDVAQYWDDLRPAGGAGDDLDLRARPARHVPSHLPDGRFDRRQRASWAGRSPSSSEAADCSATRSTR